MPIKPPVFDPPFNIVRASHVSFGSRDIGRTRAFYVDCLGYIVTAETPDALYLRAVEERGPHSIRLLKSGEPCVHRLGFKVASEEDLDRAARWFNQRGLPAAFETVPYQGRTLRASDPLGMPLEFYASMDKAECLIRRYAEYRGARIQRIDHINCFTPDVQASYDFYTSLGFRLTEYTETDGDDPKLWAVWMHRKGNVHDLAFTNGRGPRLHHIGVWTASALDILNGKDEKARNAFAENLVTAYDELTREGRFGAGVKVTVFHATVYDPTDGEGNFAEAGCPGYLSAIPKQPTKAYWDNWNKTAADAIAKYGDAIVTVDLRGKFQGHGVGKLKDGTSWFAADCIHPNKTGHDEIRKLFFSAIAP